MIEQEEDEVSLSFLIEYAVDVLRSHLKKSITNLEKNYGDNDEVYRKWMEDFTTGFLNCCNESYSKTQIKTEDSDKGDLEGNEISQESNEIFQRVDEFQARINEMAIEHEKRIEEFKKLVLVEKALREELGCIPSKEKSKKCFTMDSMLKFCKKVKYLQSLKMSRLKVVEKFKPKIAALVIEGEVKLDKNSVIHKVLTSDKEAMKRNLCNILPIEYYKLKEYLSDIRKRKTDLYMDMKPLRKFFSNNETDCSVTIKSFDGYTENAVEEMKKYYRFLLDRKKKFEKEINCCKNDINSYRKICFKEEKIFPAPENYKDLDNYKKELKELRDLFSCHETLFLKTNLLIESFKDLEGTVQMKSHHWQSEKEISKKIIYISDLYEEILELSKIYELKSSECFSIKGVPFDCFFKQQWKEMELEKLSQPILMSMYQSLKRKLDDITEVSVKKRILEGSFIE